MSDGDTRLAELEGQIAFLEDTVNSLNSALGAQQQQILELGDQMRLLHQQLKEQGARLDTFDGPNDQPPPHY